MGIQRLLERRRIGGEGERDVHLAGRRAEARLQDAQRLPGKLLKGAMEVIFVAALKILAAKGYVRLDKYFVDGTKIESASGRYTFVWKNAAKKNDRKLDEKLRAYARLAEKAWDEENDEYGESDLEELGGKDGYTSADVKLLAGVLKERYRKAGRGGRQKEKTDSRYPIQFETNIPY